MFDQKAQKQLTSKMIEIAAMACYVACQGGLTNREFLKNGEGGWC